MSIFIFFASIGWWFTSVLAQIGSDGFDNNPCLRLRDFEIDGDWWAEEQGAVDWSSVLEGTRDTLSNSEWQSTQNQCTINPAIRWGYYYKAGIFCDTYDLNEQSQLQNNNKQTSDCCPDQWIPLLTSPMQDKGDLTNAYYVGSDMDLIICAAFERIDVNGASYMDMEFNQEITQQHALYPTECNETAGTEWKCWYPLRHDGDLQISFKIANDITGNVITISTWDSTAGNNGEFVPQRVEDMSNWQGVQTKYTSADGAFRCATNNVTTKASSFGYVCDDKDIAANCTMIDKVGAFFEACIDFKILGWTSMSFQGLVIKARASAQGAYKDTSGALYHIINGPKNDWDNPTTNALCGITSSPTKTPTRDYTPTFSPTTATPTQDTVSPTQDPSLSPTAATVQPTTSPTDTPTASTAAPTGAPTSQTSDPTKGPTTSPTAVTSEPSTTPTGSPSSPPTTVTGVPTKSPITLPTQPPTTPIPSSSPSGVPTTDPTGVPTTDPTEQPTEKPTNAGGQTKPPAATTTRKAFGDQWGEAFGGGGDGEDACTDGFVKCYPGVFAVLFIAGVAFVVYWIVGVFWFKHRQGNRPTGYDKGPSYVADNVEMGGAHTTANKWKSQWEMEQERKASGAPENAVNEDA